MKNFEPLSELILRSEQKGSFVNFEIQVRL